MELLDELEVMNRQLNEALRTMRQNGIAKAQAEKDYKEMVSKESLRLRDEGMPVTLIDKVIYGLPSVSTLRFQRDCAEVVYNANLEAINIRKLQMRIIDKQISREWGTPE